MADNRKQKMDDARDMLRGMGGTSQEYFDLAKELKGMNVFGYARRLLARAREEFKEELLKDDARSLLFAQQHALCTYKDPDLPVYRKLTAALEILGEAENLETTSDRETLGLAGAIHKRLWHVDSNKTHLEQSFSYYNRGYNNDPAADQGYTAINTAYVLDLLAHLEERSAAETGAVSETAQQRRATAAEIRKKIVTELPKLAEASPDLNKNWWFLVTMAEASFGLGDFDKADHYLAQARAHNQEEIGWKFESAATQLASLAQIAKGAPQTYDDLKKQPGWAVVAKFLDNRDEAVSSIFSGKFGVGLSGGGFRASLFHIGVLAKMAELDLLRHVHVLSCVSGGSILGAYYYLELRKLLKEKDDVGGADAITRRDYIELVERIAKHFVAGVQRNVRTRVLGNPIANLRMLFTKYTRTDRVGELYERELYSRITDGEGSDSRHISKLFIHPKGTNGFNPKHGNWLRRNKVPMLVLNATTLNTGHNWQFTASWMGESPFSVDADVDGNWRYRRMYYDEAPADYNKVRLGAAVGASACVPGLFPPVSFPALYPDDESHLGDMTIRLVDGGVHDNQGITSLLEQDCSVLFISDASGQMNSSNDSGGGTVKPVMRMNSALMARVRQAQFADLKARERASLLKGLAVVHMKMGLEVDPVSWKDCREPADIPLRHRGDLLEYGVRRKTQERLAAIRTDLDSFSDVEAFSLMASGYLMTEENAGAIKTLPQHQGPRHDWEFLAVEEALKGNERPEKQKRFDKLLDVGSGMAGKVLQISAAMKLAALIVLAGLVGVGIFLWNMLPEWLPFVSDWHWGLSTGFWVLLGSVIGLLLMSVVVFIHIKVFDARFISLGRIDRVLK